MRVKTACACVCISKKILVTFALTFTDKLGYKSPTTYVDGPHMCRACHTRGILILYLHTLNVTRVYMHMQLLHTPGKQL